jgi:hypothetical protein
LTLTTQEPREQAPKQDEKEQDPNKSEITKSKKKENDAAAFPVTERDETRR